MTRHRAQLETEQTEGREFEIDDRCIPVDELMNDEPRRRSWRDERKPEPIAAFPMGDKVSNNRGRAYRRGLPSSLTRNEWLSWRRAFDKCCAYCGDKQTDPIMDHVVPVSRDGGTTIYNVLPACQSCNSKKRDMDPISWLAIIGWDYFLERLAAALKRIGEKA